MGFNFQHNTSLKTFNTFGLDVKTAVFCEVDNLQALKQAISETDQTQIMFLGGGSNVLFCNDYNGLVIHNNIKGMQIIAETDNDIILKAYSGEIWHDLVMYCVDQGWGGIENMSLIPGTLGAAPMQNIGAYGVELEQVFVELEALNLQTFELETFSREQCQFAYRESVFKRQLKGQYFIYSVSIKLSKQPQINVAYGDILTVLNSKGIDPSNATIKDVSNAVIAIRSEKLPDPKVLGNSGSFFKNPTVSVEQFNALQNQFPNIKGFPQSNGVKIPAAWLIEQAGWKGKQVGQTGSHAKQALVIVNYGHATGPEIYQHALNVIESVYAQFGVKLEPEVNLIQSVSNS